MTDHTTVILLQQMNIRVSQIMPLHFYIIFFTCMVVSLRGTKGHFMVQHGSSLGYEPQRLREVSTHYFSSEITKHDSTIDEI